MYCTWIFVIVWVSTHGSALLIGYHVTCWTSGGFVRTGAIVVVLITLSLFPPPLSPPSLSPPSSIQTPYYWPSQNPVDNDVEYGKP